LFSHLEGIVNLDAEVAYRAFKVRVTQEQLDSPEVLGAPVNQGRPRPPHGVRTMGARIQSDVL
jgi:hypothetical protein